MKWSLPWEPVEDGSALTEALRRELVPGHALFDVPVRALARRCDTDDVLYGFVDGSGRVAVVHLTWQPGMSARWPYTEVLPDLATFAERVMRPDHTERG
ncbi:hypothetical protein [Tahibacter amnicola]|uniref:Uncharacterized protein n=1 Tax=Tahibacter amnicola TaxID=2976241 RepID=A0ABY6BBD3_9GAMM|nr:hypothetical protein [Tahibacter amnicola]UXI66847.1 hypothetical protein N4264_19115 [Tahibacter amnicola]